MVAPIIAPLLTVAIVAANRRREAEEREEASRPVQPMSKTEFRRLMDEMDRERERRERRRVPDVVWAMLLVILLTGCVIGGTCAILTLMDVPLPSLTVEGVLTPPTGDAVGSIDPTVFVFLDVDGHAMRKLCMTRHGPPHPRCSGWCKRAAPSMSRDMAMSMGCSLETRPS